VRRTLTLLLLLTLLSAACGDGDDTGGTAAPAPTTSIPVGDPLAPGGGGDEVTVPIGTVTVCALNEEFAELNERTLGPMPDVAEGEPIPDAYAALLEENFVGTVDLLRRMVDQAPAALHTDLSVYTAAISDLSEMYAEFGFRQATVWQNADYDTYFQEHPGREEARARVGAWFLENCGIDLQG
jgi:hypothetical protein